MSKLFSPIKLAGLELSNRIVVAPMCQYSSDQGKMTDWHLVHLTSLSMSGAGLVVIEGTDVDPSGHFTKNCLGLYTDEQERALKRVVDNCKRVGNAAIGLQLTHGGRKAGCNVPWVNAGRPLREEEGRWNVLAPSAIPFADDWAHPIELDKEGLARLRDAFVSAAQRANRAGVDSLELHGAHGYFIHQFLTPLTNTRDDEYGGSFENRMRFPLELFGAIRDAWPAGKPLGIRISGIDWVEGGLTLEQAARFSQCLGALGCNFICVSSGGLVPGAAPPKVEAGYQVSYAEEIAVRSGVPTRAVGLISDPKHAEAIVAEGKVSMVALGRAFLDDPRWGWHAAAALGVDIPYPQQYERSHHSLWPGSKYFVPGAAFKNTNRFMPRGFGS